MATLQVINPFSSWFDNSGTPLNGTIYVGQAGLDPTITANQLALTFAGAVPASQPLSVINGRIVNGSTPAAVFVPNGTTAYSIRVLDNNGNPVDTQLNVPLIDNYQPLDSDLTAIAALTTTTYGRALLTLANQAGLQAAVGIPAALPLAGGTVTGDITRNGAGVYTYAASGTAGKIMVLPTSDTTTSTTGAFLVFRY